VPVGGLLLGTKNEQVIPVGLGFDFRLGGLDSQIFFAPCDWMFWLMYGWIEVF